MSSTPDHISQTPCTLLDRIREYLPRANDPAADNLQAQHPDDKRLECACHNGATFQVTRTSWNPCMRDNTRTCLPRPGAEAARKSKRHSKRQMSDKWDLLGIVGDSPKHLGESWECNPCNCSQSSG
eukprot:CAMPEP_0203912088 /NCGR_PEP_ID=MMETSP0359-20131031/53183_1 /ASSEMBLY_ACC=CAM_ASM_000338 /TAXON_ID=268821 /ORGANISM="Scrippsiella Hangoei, Strain SHTV-5" /LENGTH=125 /DNA_ID=CAMNT_0050837947 /DNA_START=56 /DNA_END=429 /DNA_ORIENTATION=+